MEKDQAHVTERLNEINAYTGGEEFNALKSVYKDFAETAYRTDMEGVVGLFEKMRDEYASALGGGEAPFLSTVIDNISDETWQALEGMLEYSLNGYAPDGFELVELIDRIREELDAAIMSDPLKVKPEPVLPDDAGSKIQEQLSGLSPYVIIRPVIGSIGGGVDGEHANGLPFVPFDGYIAALHRGERVVPASQNKSYTNTSNVYFDHVNVNNGIDADGLAAKIAERTRHTLAGFGG